VVPVRRERAAIEVEREGVDALDRLLPQHAGIDIGFGRQELDLAVPRPDRFHRVLPDRRSRSRQRGGERENLVERHEPSPIDPPRSDADPTST